MLHQYDIVFRTVLTRSCVRFECRPPACRQTPVFRHHSETTDRSRFAALNPLQCEHTALGSIRQRPIGVDLIQMAAGDTTACSTPTQVNCQNHHRTTSPGVAMQKDLLAIANKVIDEINRCPHVTLAIAAAVGHPNQLPQAMFGTAPTVWSAGVTVGLIGRDDAVIRPPCTAARCY